MNFVLINQYYPPDEAPTGLMLEVVAERLAEQGHEVTVICSAAGGYAGGGKGGNTAPSSGVVRLVRIGATRFGRGSFIGKLADYISFYVGVGWSVMRLRPSPDRVVALTTPPYLSVLVRIASKLRGADHAHWVMDLYPDVMVSHGMLKEGGMLHRLLASLTKFGFGGKRCAALVTLGPDMGERCSGYMAEGRQATVVPLWASDAGEQGAATTGEAERVAALRRERGWKEVVFMYSGNMGLGHRFGEFLEWAGAASKNGGARMVFYGGGKRRPEVEEFMASRPEAPIELHDYVPREVLGPHLLSADVHLASLEPCWDGTMVPSKLQGVFGAGRPVIFVGSRSSSIGAWIEESGGGWVVDPGNQEALAQATEEAMDPEQRRVRGEAAVAFAEEHFDRRKNALRVADALAGGQK